METVIDYKNIKFSFENCCIIDGDRWFFANELNALCMMKLGSDEVTFVGMVPEEKIFSKYLFADIKYFKGKIYLIPRGASALVIYDLSQNSFKRVNIEIPSSGYKNHYLEWLKFSIGILLGNKLFMIPRTYPGIGIFDIETEEIFYEKSWIGEIEKYIFENEAYFWADYDICDGELILAGANSDCLMRRAMETGTYTIEKLPNDCNGYSGIACIEDNIVLASRKNGNIILLNRKNNTVEHLELPEGFKVNRIIGFSKLIVIRNNIYAIPMWSNYLLKINLNEKKTEVIKNYDVERDKNKEIATCCGWEEDGNLFCHNNLCKHIDVFADNKPERIIKLDMSEQFYEDFLREMRRKNDLLDENDTLSLRGFLNYVKMLE